MTRERERESSLGRQHVIDSPMLTHHDLVAERDHLCRTSQLTTDFCLYQTFRRCSALLLSYLRSSFSVLKVAVGDRRR